MACNSKQKLIEDIECEGFFYALFHYDDYSEIPDPVFQQLYKQLLETAAALGAHLGVPHNT